MAKIKTKIIDDIEWEEMGPYCKLCKAHMGIYYSYGSDPCYINPHNYESYGNNQCPECGAKHVYDEGNVLHLTEEELKVILAKRQGRAHMDQSTYDKMLIKWAKNHYWDSLEKDKDLILRHFRTFVGDGIYETD